jgi:hypothetical protein
VGSYLDIARKARVEGRQAGEVVRTVNVSSPPVIGDETLVEQEEAGDQQAAVGTVHRGRDQSDISDQSSAPAVSLTVAEVLAEINRPQLGAAKNAELYRRGELSKDKAVEYVACAILHRRGESFQSWRQYAPAVEAALTHPFDCDCQECL